MSHFKQRKQNDCLNCGAVVYGRYCHLCGQENLEPKETFWHLITHFVYDITHFDGKFFNTVKYLLLKPGFLPREYVFGRRMRYLNPIKMYIFISAFFFLLFFAFISPSEKQSRKVTKPTVDKVKSDIQEQIEVLKSDLKDSTSGTSTRQANVRQLQLLQQDLQRIAGDTGQLENLNYSRIKDSTSFLGEYKSAAEYDSIQNRATLEKKDSWLTRTFIAKALYLRQNYGTDIIAPLFDKFRHSFPQLLFISLPLIALLLKLLYIRRKQFYYVDHVIYTVHLYCAMFILLFIMLVFSKLEHFQYLSWLEYCITALVIYSLWYQYKSLRNFYEGSRLKTLLKYLLLLFMSSIVMSVLFLVFLVLSILKL